MPRRGGAGSGGPHVIVAGYYGHGNIGDEAILRALLADVHRLRPDVRFSVLRGGRRAATLDAGSEVAAAAAGPAVSYVPRLAPAAVSGAMRRADLMLLGGGGLIQDVTSLRSLSYYLGLLWLAHRRRLPAAVYGGGVGPVRGRFGRWLTRRVLPNVELAALRDRASMATARSLGVPEEKLLLTADPAFSLTPAADPTHPADAAVTRALVEAGVPPERCSGGGGLVGLALRPPLAAADEAAVAAAIRRLSCDLDLFPLLIPFHPEQDLRLLAAIGAASGRPHAVLRRVRQPGLLLGVVSRLRVVVAMRLHGAIFAVTTGVPCVALSYDPKVDALAADVPAIRYATYPGVDAGELGGHVAACLRAEGEIRRDLLAAAAKLRRRARANAAAAVDLLGRLGY